MGLALSFRNCQEKNPQIAKPISEVVRYKLHSVCASYWALSKCAVLELKGPKKKVPSGMFKDGKILRREPKDCPQT